MAEYDATQVEVVPSRDTARASGLAMGACALLAHWLAVEEGDAALPWRCDLQARPLPPDACAGLHAIVADCDAELGRVMERRRQDGAGPEEVEAIGNAWVMAGGVARLFAAVALAEHDGLRPEAGAVLAMALDRVRALLVEEDCG